MTFKEKIMLAKKNNIFIPFDLADNQNIVGVYKIFGKKMEDAHAFILENQPILHIDCLVQGEVIFICI